MSIKRLDLFSPAIQSVSSVGPVTPTEGLDVSAVVGDWTLRCQVLAMTANKTFRIAVEGSFDAFVTVKTHMIACGGGSIDKAADKTYAARRYQLDSFGVIGYLDGRLRVNVIELQAGATLQLRVWLEHGSTP